MVFLIHLRYILYAKTGRPRFKPAWMDKLFQKINIYGKIFFGLNPMLSQETR